MKKSCLALIGCLVTWGYSQMASADASGIMYAPAGKKYYEKMDFARVESDYPLDKNALARLDPEDLEKMNQEQLDQIYARLTAGPIPNGQYKGRVVFAQEAGLRRIAEATMKRNLKFTFAGLKLLAQYLWKGKHFYRDERVLRNMMANDFFVEKLLSAILPGKIETSGFLKAKWDGKEVMEIFPAKLYCGQSLMDSRRESVIIDYAYSQDVTDYQESIDYIANRDYLGVRDEIRMIRPGFYLGRAYMQRMFGLYFVLYNEGVAKKPTERDKQEDCWTGTQPRKLQASK
jgi:hypothetical protein